MIQYLLNENKTLLVIIISIVSFYIGQLNTYIKYNIKTSINLIFIYFRNATVVNRTIYI